MKLRIEADRKYVLNRILEAADALQGRTADPVYDLPLGDSIAELVKIHMGEAARTLDVGQLSGDEILNDAIRRVASELQNAMKRIDLNDYLSEARKALNRPAKEVAKSRKELRSSKDRAKVGEEQLVPGAQPYWVKELGLRGAIDGFLVFSTADVLSINLDRVRTNHEVRGDWFPFEILHEELVVILDDDGSLFLSTKRLSDVRIPDARKFLAEVAGQLYS